MSNPDLILLHAPSVYDFRRESIMHGPISDVIPSTPIFEMYPIGFVSISEYLERNGYEVRIINLAMKMLNSPRFNVERLIRSLRPKAFGIDLHWMPHVNGSLAVAEIVKKYHPRIPVIFGGFSSTYFHDELIKTYPQIDYVVRGDSTEEPMMLLMRTIEGGKKPVDIPNVTWRDGEGHVICNPMAYVPEDLDNIAIDYSHIIKKAFKYMDFSGYEPFRKWFHYPITAVFSCRGCSHNCRTCGASSWALSKMVGRSRPAYRDPKLLARDIEIVQDHLNAPIFIIGDPLQPGRDYVIALMDEIKKKKIKSQVIIEFFVPPEDEVLEKIAHSIPNYNIEISPESHDVEVRRAFGRPYDNVSLERMIKRSLELGCGRIDLFFMTGLPKQTYQSVLDIVEYCRRILEIYGEDGRVFPFISPLAPFLDPGSMAFENPEAYGYKLLFKTVEEHRRALLNPSWKYFLNYETQWMTRDEIVYSTYEVALRLNRLKAEFGLVDKKNALRIKREILATVEVMRKIDEIMEIPDEERREDELKRLGLHLKKLNMNTMCGEGEWKWPAHFIRMNVFKILKTLMG